jgi:hypothetical protein
MGAQVIPISDRTIKIWLRNYPPKFLACRQAHNFPKLIPGQRKLTRTWVERDDDGNRTIHQSCTCGRERWRPLNANNTLGGNGWKYKDPPGYAQPSGYGLTRADFAAVYWPAIVSDLDESNNRVQEYLGNEHSNES